jgi:porphobilinogen synthase
VAETRLHRTDFIYPLFVVPGEKVRREVPSMPGVFNLSIDEAVEECRKVADAGIPAVILFGIPEHKDAQGSGAHGEDGIVQRATKAIKKALPNLLVVVDTCLCEYTDHGHCAPVENGEILNDAALEILQTTAVTQAQAGADWIAPSGMMDGMIMAIRSALDAACLENVPILSYSAKYASGFYGPFRDAAQSTPSFGDRRSHQMDPANSREAIREMETDIAEGADALMVKPALAYLDIIKQARDRFSCPIAAYQVSGEYAMIKFAGKQGLVDERRVALESLISIKRAGADMILSYFALEAAKWPEIS